MLSYVAYTPTPSEEGSNQQGNDAKDNWRPDGFRNTVSENVYAGRTQRLPNSVGVVCLY